MSAQHTSDKDDSRKRTSVWKAMRRMLVFFVATASLAVVYYIVFALLFSTAEERRLEAENEIYESEYPLLHQKEQLISEVVEGLMIKDDRIYKEIFNTSAPNVNPSSSIDFYEGVDSISDRDIVIYAHKKIEKASESAALVQANFERIMQVIQAEDYVLPPMSNPIENYSFAQTGASIGEKMNPFYKVPLRHDGLDMIAPAGEPVYASADGVVKNVIRSKKGLGNVVEIQHKGGYISRYAHLADIEVRKGRSLKKGSRIGYVGISGNSFAPHLHYEVIRDTLVMDPVNYMFASVTPQEYMNMMVMAVTTGQSMD